MSAMETKGKKLSGYLMNLLNLVLGDKVRIITPAAETSRGCQVSFTLDDVPTKKVFVYLFDKILLSSFFSFLFLL